MFIEMQNELDNLNYKITDEQVNFKSSIFITKWFTNIWWAVIAVFGIVITYQLWQFRKMNNYLSILLLVYYLSTTLIRNMYISSLQRRLRKY
jgi:hypothetical protein